MTLSDIGAMLSEITTAYHYEAFEETGNYIVWAEDGQSDIQIADNKVIGQVIQGTIDYFTKDEYDPIFNTIQEKLNSSELVWRLNSIQPEKDIGYIHYEWIWENNIPVGGE